MHSRERSRWWGRAALAVAVVSALCAGGAWLLSRESTLIAAAQYLERRLDGRLAVADVKGSLLGSIHVRELRYADDFGRLAIDDARMEWRPLRLLNGQVAVGAMSANAVRVELAKTEDERREPPQSLSAPISFAVTDFTIGTLSIVQPDATHAISDIRAAFAGNRKALKAEVKSLATQWGHVKGELTIGASRPFPLGGGIEIASLEAGRYALTTTLGGSLLETEARLEAKAAEGTASAKLVVAPYDEQPLTHLELLAKDFDPRAWTAAAPAAKLHAEARIVADEARRLTGGFVLENSEPGTIDARKVPFARASAAVQGTLKALALGDIKLDFAQAGQFTGAGELRDGDLDVKLSTRNLNLQGVQKRLHKTGLNGTLAFGGTAQRQRVRFDLAQAPYKLGFKGTFSEGIARIEQVYARAGAAELAGAGRVALDAQKSFAVAGQLRNFDPSKFGAYPAHVINGRFDVKGHAQPVLQIAANVDIADSRLGGLPATGRGAFRTQRSDHPDVAMDVSLRVGDTRAAAKGIVRDPAGRRSMDMDLTLEGKSLAELYKVVGVPLPGTPPYRIKGRLVQRDEQWELKGFAGAVGESDLAGDFLVDRGRKPQFLKAELKSNRLALADLAGFIGAEKAESGKVVTPTPGRVLPTTPYSLEKLNAADADVRFEGRRILTQTLPVENMSTHLILKGGVLTLAPLNFGVAGGNLVSHITLDGRASVIASRADIRVQALQLSQLTPKLKISKASIGEVDGRVRLTARGNSIAAMLGSANGDTTLVMGEGEVSDLILRLANLDIANTLLVLMRGDRNIPVRCMVADLAFENGIMRPRQFVFDTAHTTLVGEGSANFANETLDLRLAARPRGKSLMSLRGPIVVRGTFDQPSVMPDMKNLAARGVAVTALAVLAAPVAALVPLIQLGGAEEVHCGPLVARAKQAIARPAPALAAVATP